MTGSYNVTMENLCRFRTSLFNGIYDISEQQRSVAIDNIIQIIRQWAHTIVDARTKLIVQQQQQLHSNGSSDDRFSPLVSPAPQAASPLSFASSGSPTAVEMDAETLEETKRVLRFHILIVLRMSHNCPFEDVRTRFSALLGELKSLGIPVPRPAYDSPSYFIAKDKCVTVQGSSGAAFDIMSRVFLSSGRLSNVTRLMAYFPTYLDKFITAYNHILRYQGPLPRSWRNYIAIMAASEHQCQYIVSLQTQEFLQNGGEGQWLDGLKNAPEKLQLLAKLNGLMAHRPWLIKHEHIEQLLRGSEKDNWSMSELVQAIVLLAEFHSLSSFVLGCGIVSEIDMEGGTIEDLQVGLGIDGPYGAENAIVSDIQQPLSSLSSYTAQLLDRLKSKEHENTEFSTPQAEVFEKLEVQETFNGNADLETANNSAAFLEESFRGFARTSNRNLDIYRSEDKVYRVDFDVKSTEYSIFRLQDYSWEEHGVSLISKYLNETAELLDDEFNTIQDLTDYSLFNTKDENESVDTWPFRQAIWYYVLRLHGMSHDDYNYHEVNIYLNKRIKQYIKKVVCYPETVYPADFINMGFTFRPDEKVQINLLATEARKCAEILYALHALTKNKSI